MLALGGEGTQQCPRYLGSNGTPALSAPRTEIDGSLYPRRGLGIKLLYIGQGTRPLCVVTRLGKRHLFFDPKSGIAKLELFLNLSGARAQKTVADNDVTS